MEHSKGNLGAALKQKYKGIAANRATGYLAFLPFLLVVLCYELLPLLQLIGSSLIGKESGLPGLENYIKIFSTPLYRQSILNSVRISAVSAVLGIIIAFLAARYCTEAGAGGQRIFTMILNMTSNFSGVLTLLGQNLGIPLFASFDLYSGRNGGRPPPTCWCRSA